MSVFVANLNKNSRQYEKSAFLGTACDTSSKKTVVRHEHFRAYRNQSRLPLSLLPDNSILIFGDMSCNRLGIMCFLLLIPSTQNNILAHVVPIRMSFLIGLDSLDYQAWNILTGRKKLQRVRKNWLLPHIEYRDTVSSYGHLQLPHFDSRQKLSDMHLHFMNPSTSKLFAFLDRAFQ